MPKLNVEHGDENTMTTLKVSYCEANGKMRYYLLEGETLSKICEKYVKVGLIRRREGTWYVRNDRGRYVPVGTHIETDFWGRYRFYERSLIDNDGCTHFYDARYASRRVCAKPELLGSSYEQYWWPRTVKVWGSAGHYWLQDCQGNQKKVSFVEAVDAVRSEGRICSDGSPVWRGRKLWRGRKETYQTITIAAGLSRRRLVVKDLSRGRVKLELAKIEDAYDKCGFYPQQVVLYPTGDVYLVGLGNDGMLAYVAE